MFKAAAGIGLDILTSLLVDEIKEARKKKADNFENSVKYYEALLKGWTESSKQYHQSVARDLKNRMEKSSMNLAEEGDEAKALQNKITGLDKAYIKIKNTMSKGGYSKKEKEIVEKRYLDAKENLEALKEKEDNSQCTTPTVANDAAKRAMEKVRAEEEALAQWLESYKKSKMSEVDITTNTYNEQLDKFYELLDKKKISQEEYDNFIEQSTNDYNAKLEEIEKKETENEQRKLDEKNRLEKNAKEQMLRLKETYATTDEERNAIVIERINQKYNEELKLAKENGIAEAEVERAKLAEIEAIKRNAADKDAENRKAAQEFSWQLRETAAADEEERCNVQMERMNARYDAELEKARGNATLITEIERARVAEAERLENQLLQTRLNTTGQYANSFMTIAQSMATIGKAGGNTMKAIAITEAIINTALAATKAMTSAPPPLNFILAAATTAAGMAQVATIKSQKFAKGGVVEGNSYYGDYVPVKANSGEMILNKEQQKELFKIANGGKESGGSPIVVNFSPQIAQGLNKADVKKMLKENQAEFTAFISQAFATGAGKTGVFI